MSGHKPTIQEMNYKSRLGLVSLICSITKTSKRFRFAPSEEGLWLSSRKG